MHFGAVAMLDNSNKDLKISNLEIEIEINTVKHENIVDVIYDYKLR
jgi:hypothetical protein